jgi:hypothetical protein
MARQMLVDVKSEKIGKLHDVFFDVKSDKPQVATIKEGVVFRHFTFVPLGRRTVGPDEIKVTVTKEQVASAPDIWIHGQELSQLDESTLYHHFEMNYTPLDAAGGRRLVRRQGHSSRRQISAIRLRKPAETFSLKNSATISMEGPLPLRRLARSRYLAAQHPRS